MRIEDTDRERNVAGSEDQLFHDLKWLGIEFDESVAVGGVNLPYRQSERTKRHKDAAERLLASGAAYRCWCSPERLSESRSLAQIEGRPPRYNRRCLHISEDDRHRLTEEHTPFVVRLLTENDRKLEIADLFRGIVTFEGQHLDDPILVRSDGSPTTLLAGVVDDLDMGMTHILRGEEWLASTPYQFLIFEALGGPLPVWGHLSLLLGEDGAKLSKRTPGLTIKEMRENGTLPEAINRYLAGLGRETIAEEAGWTMKSLAEGFDPIVYRAGGTVFSMTALSAESGRLIRKLGPIELRSRLEEAYPGFWFPKDWDHSRLNRAIELASEAAETIADLRREFNRLALPSDPATLNWTETSRPIDALEAVHNALSETVSWNESELDAAIKDAGKKGGLKGRELFVPIRLAVTGTEHGPRLAAIAALLGREEFLHRLATALKHIGSLIIT